MKLLFTIFLTLSFLISQSSAQQDSLQLDTFYIISPELSQSARFQQIDETQRYASMQEAVLSNTGAYARNYAPGQSSTINLLGASSSQTKVLWKGIDISNPMLGLMDLSIIPFPFFERSVIDYMPSSDNESIGGALRLEGSKLTENQFSTQFLLNSANNIQVATFWTKVRKKSSHKLQVYGLSAQNKYTVDLPTYTYSMDYSRQKSWQIKYDLESSHKKWKFNQSIWYARSDRQIPGSNGQNNQNDKQLDENIRYQISARKRSKNLEIRLQAAYLRDLIHFQNDFINTPGLAQRIVLKSQFQSFISPNFQYRSQLRFIPSSGSHPSYQETKTQILNADSYQGLEFYKGDFRVKTYVSFAYNHVSSFQVQNPVLAINPQFDAIYSFGPSDFQIQIHRSSRFPTINDISWSPGGNPNLIPEQAWKYSGVYRIAKSRSSLKILGFYRKTDNMILWTPRNGIWSPQNILKVRSIGWQLDAKISRKLNKNLSIIVQESYYNIKSVNDSKISPYYNKQLIYMPRHKWDNQIEIRWKNVGLSYYSQWVSTRNTSQDGFAILNPYFRQDVRLNYRKTLARKQEINVYLALKNFADQIYQHQAGFYQIGRHLELNIQYKR